MDNITQQQELLPCPFCGGKAEVDQTAERFEYCTGGPNSVMEYGYMVYCTKCDASKGMINVPPSTEEEAIAEWNRRAHVGILPALAAGESRQYHSLPSSEMSELRNAHIRFFYRRVCEMAEKNMASTGTVSGAHWNAMRQVLALMHVDVSDIEQSMHPKGNQP